MVFYRENERFDPGYPRASFKNQFDYAQHSSDREKQKWTLIDKAVK